MRLIEPGHAPHIDPEQAGQKTERQEDDCDDRKDVGFTIHFIGQASRKLFLRQDRAITNFIEILDVSN